jgi:hypothetical protein
MVGLQDPQASPAPHMDLPMISHSAPCSEMSFSSDMQFVEVDMRHPSTYQYLSPDPAKKVC